MILFFVVNYPYKLRKAPFGEQSVWGILGGINFYGNS